jgi:hypothetical protein
MSELSDDHTYVLKLAFSISLPDGLRESLRRPRLVRMSDQVLQNKKFLGREMAHLAAGTFNLVGF